MSPAILALLVTAAPAPAKLKLAQGGVAFVDVAPDKGAFFVSTFDQRLSVLSGLRVVTQDEVGAVLGLERQKAMLGCSESSCTAELAGALGVDGIIIGTLAKVGGVFTLNLKAVRSSNAEPMSLVSLRAANEAELLDALDTAARQIGREVLQALAPAGSAPARVEAPGPTPPAWWWTPVAAGVVAGGVGALFYAQAAGTRDRIASHDPSIQSQGQLEAAMKDGQGQQALAFALGAVGLAGIAGGVAWRLVGSISAQPSVAVWSGGASMGVSGSWP